MAHLLVEDTVPFVDVGNVAFVLVDTLAMEFTLLLDAGEY